MSEDDKMCRNCGKKPFVTQDRLCMDCKVQSNKMVVEVQKGRGFGKSKEGLDVEVETKDAPTKEDVETAKEILEDLRAKCEMLTGSSVWQHATIEQCREYLTSEKAKKDRETFDSEAYSEPKGVAPSNISTGGF